MIGLLRTLSELTRGKPLVCGQVYLRPPVRGDWSAWAALRAASRAYLEPWEPSWSGDALTRKAFVRRLRVHAINSQADKGYAFLIFARRSHDLVGGVSLNHVRRGIGQTASIGYWIGERYARRGYMTDALTGLLPFAFDGLGLHRLDAAVLERNVASRRVLEKAGFTREGVARKYLRIDGEWQDHVIYGMLSTDPRPAPVEAVACPPPRKRPFARKFDHALTRTLKLKSGS